MFTPLNPSVFYERERGKAYFLLCGYLAVRLIMLIQTLVILL